MSVIPLYIPEYHDRTLIALHQRLKLNDYEIADRMEFPPAVITSQRKRIGLKAHPRVTPKLRERLPEQHAKPDPLAVAQKWVPGFNRLNLTLHGQPVKLPYIMKLCNQQLKLNSIDQIGPPSWRI